MKKLLGIVLALLVTGCSLPLSNEYTAYISPEFSAKENGELVEVLHKWEQAASQFGLKFNIVQGIHTCEYDCFTYYPATTAQLNAVFKKALGVTHYDDCTNCGHVLLGELPDDNEQKTMIAHEVGHTLGLGHVGPGHLMYPDYGKNQPNAITCGDIKQYASLRNERIVFCDGDVEIAPLSK